MPAPTHFFLIWFWNVPHQPIVWLLDYQQCYFLGGVWEPCKWNLASRVGVYRWDLEGYLLPGPCIQSPASRATMVEGPINILPLSTILCCAAFAQWLKLLETKKQKEIFSPQSFSYNIFPLQGNNFFFQKPPYDLEWQIVLISQTWCWQRESQLSFIWSYSNKNHSKLCCLSTEKKGMSQKKDWLWT